MQARCRLLVLLTLLAGCGHSLSQPNPMPAITPTPVPTPTAIPRVMSIDFEGFTPGILPKDFISVRDEIPSNQYAWLTRGIWVVSDVATGSLQSRALRQGDVRKQPSATFLRYTGEMFGKPNGALPDKYRAEVTLQPIQSPYNYPPTGDQGTPMYYIDPTHYLEVVMKPDQIEAWECDGGEPEKGEGWYLLFQQSYKTLPGDVRRIGAEVDMSRQLFTVLLNGAPIHQHQVPSLRNNRPHYFALRAIGNEVNYDDIRIERLD